VALGTFNHLLTSYWLLVSELNITMWNFMAFDRDMMFEISASGHNPYITRFINCFQQDNGIALP